MRAIFAFIATFGVVCAAHSLVDYRVYLSASASKPLNCTTSGLLCETCSDLVACILNSDNTWSKKNVKTCSNGEKCIKNECTTQYDPVCDHTVDLTFPCQEVGIFPDPFYCNKFIMCVQVNGKLQAYSNKCEEGLGYNIGTGLCDIKLENGECKSGEYPLPLCSTPGQTDALPNKPQEYYICDQYSKTQEVLYPFINACPMAGKYENYKCSP